MRAASDSKRSAKSSRDKVHADRARLRAQGLRPILIWVPDTRTRRFVAEAHRQSLLIASSPQEEDDQGFVDATSALDPGWHFQGESRLAPYPSTRAASKGPRGSG